MVHQRENKECKKYDPSLKAVAEEDSELGIEQWHCINKEKGIDIQIEGFIEVNQ